MISHNLAPSPLHSTTFPPTLPSPSYSLAHHRKTKCPRSENAMHAYYFDNLPTDQRLPHITDPARPVSPETLAKLGVLSWHVPVDGHESGVDESDDEFEVNRVAKERGYKNRDVINVSREGMGAVYEEKIRGGFFDVREMPNDAWIRIVVAPGDLLVLPAGIYHRFTLDTKDQIRALRLFKDEPKWIPHARSGATDANMHRVGYLRDIGTGISPAVGAVGA
ncbi:1,2-dihydroxy-3-keto-5-methylthiopentene dioxygenase [Mycena sanguinolenta]|uniref:acireductone dioxygenase (Fe(2+)-requiring) n=1 Tax=Mycena sanguinolenta TaxID=230812 RepID=A0A8H6Y7C6_9AGAR|nr:1,2-dihydroxy-3-keto-5-methylthiopentene dioxygenase [Mycena sanguinolenta]